MRYRWTNLILRAYTRNISTLAKKSIIHKDIETNADTMYDKTMDSYLNALERLSDPSIAVAALGLTPENLEMDLKTFGFIFEADAVLHLDNGKYALIEFKLGSREIEEGAKHLLEIKELVKNFNVSETQCPLREPDILMVITGGNMAYRRNDGVMIVPIGCLKD